MTGVLVIGAGVAGTAAALAAARESARVTLLDGGTGATALSTGALDDTPWTRAPEPSPRSPLSTFARAVLDSLGVYSVPDAGSRVATTAGVIRPARGHDLALLDLTPPALGHVGVVRCDRPDWEATALARAWGSSSLPRAHDLARDSARGPTFTPLEATVVRHVDERLLPAADFAARHDDEARLGWLAERLREALSRAGARFEALVLPPSLGVVRPRARDLSALVGLPCGEAAGLPGGPSGLRFEQARNRSLASAHVEHRVARATAVDRARHGWRVTMAGGEVLEATVVVLAMGGLVGGGLAYTPGDAAEASVLPPASRLPFQLALDVPGATLGAHGRPLELPGSLFGIPPESLAWPFAVDPLMARAGVLVDGDGGVAPGLYAAGETVADAHRTWLCALESGARAGVAAARHAVSATAERSPSAFEAPSSRP